MAASVHQGIKVCVCVCVCEQMSNAVSKPKMNSENAHKMHKTTEVSLDSVKSLALCRLDLIARQSGQKLVFVEFTVWEEMSTHLFSQQNLYDLQNCFNKPCVVRFVVESNALFADKHARKQGLNCWCIHLYKIKIQMTDT